MEKIRIMELLLHCADISNCVKPWNIHTKFTGELLEEFFKQVSHLYWVVRIFAILYCDFPKEAIHRKGRFHRNVDAPKKTTFRFWKYPEMKFLGWFGTRNGAWYLAIVRPQYHQYTSVSNWIYYLYYWANFCLTKW